MALISHVLAWSSFRIPITAAMTWMLLLAATTTLTATGGENVLERRRTRWWRSHKSYTCVSPMSCVLQCYTRKNSSNIEQNNKTMHLSWKLCVRSQLLVRLPVQIPASKQNKQTTEEPVLCAGLAVQWVDDWRADIDPWHQARRPPSCKKPVWNKVVCGGGEGRQRGKWKSRGVRGGRRRRRRRTDVLIFYEGKEESGGGWWGDFQPKWNRRVGCFLLIPFPVVCPSLVIWAAPTPPTPHLPTPIYSSSDHTPHVSQTWTRLEEGGGAGGGGPAVI